LLNQEYILQLFLNRENICVFPDPSFNVHKQVILKNLVYLMLLIYIYIYMWELPTYAKRPLPDRAQWLARPDGRSPHHGDAPANRRVDSQRRLRIKEATKTRTTVRPLNRAKRPQAGKGFRLPNLPLRPLNIPQQRRWR
jgi:hypothetical protein